MERRLAAILIADVVGYSRLMGVDEEGTLALLKSFRADLFDPKLAEHHGRVVKTTGDGALVEFASAVDAVRCAVEVQREIARYATTVPEDQRLALRIGINVGDIIIEGDDIYGDGVNVASRLESLAKPGGITISRTVFDHVAAKLDLNFDYQGEQRVKNISEPIAVYDVLLDGQSRNETPSANTYGVRPLQAIGLVAVIGLIAVAVIAAWWQPWNSDVMRPSTKRMAQTLPKMPTIAVLPFNSFSGNKQDDFIAKGITEDLITTLSKVPQLTVISRTSSFAFKSKSETAVEIAERLGINYLIEGSIQRSGGKLRINAQLIDAVKDHHLWAENFDGEAKDMFSFQDDIVRRILLELQVKLTSGEHARLASRGTTNLEAWLLWVRGFDEVFKFTREGMVRGRELFQAAHELDRKWARPLVGLSWTYWYGALKGWTDEPQAWIRKGIELAEGAVSLAPEEPGGYQMLGFLAQSQGQHDKAIALREKAYGLAPGDFFVVWGLASVLKKAGRPKQALGYYKQARRLSPRMPPAFLGSIAEAQLLAGANEDAITTSEEAITHKPGFVFPHVIRVAAYSALGRMEEARSGTTKVLGLSPRFRVSAWLRTRTYKDAATTKRIARLLVNAGLPE